MSGQRQISSVAPRLFRRERAAAYLDMSPATFDKLVKDGLIPPPKQLSSNIKAWDRPDLDSYADHLPYVEAATVPDTTWD